MGVMLQHQ